MIYVKQQSPCIGECQTPRPSVDVTFHANLELFIMGKGREKKKHLNKTDCVAYFHMQHLTIYHLIVIGGFLAVGN